MGFSPEIIQPLNIPGGLNGTSVTWFIFYALFNISIPSPITFFSLLSVFILASGGPIMRHSRNLAIEKKQDSFTRDRINIDEGWKFSALYTSEPDKLI